MKTIGSSVSILRLAAVVMVGTWTFGCSSSSNNGTDSGPKEASVNPDGGTDGVTSDGNEGDAAPDKGCTLPEPTPGACASNKIEVFKGSYQVVLNQLAIGGNNEGFDLDNGDCDNDPMTGADNVLWPLSAFASQAINESMEAGEIVVPLEFFELDDSKNDECVNFSFYLGRFPPDLDKDTRGAGGSGGKDCNDNDNTISPDLDEVAGNGVDDNCNGLADEADPTTPSTDASDSDGDGQTIAAGDCDDRAGKGETIKSGAAEICGDGLDNDCSGRADDGCLPWTEGQTFAIEDASVDANSEGVLAFRGSRIENGVLHAGPARFSISIAVDKDAFFDLNLSHVFIQADVSTDAKGLTLDNAMLGGVLSARAMDMAPNIIAEMGVGFGTEDDSLLDALVGPAGQLLALPSDAKGNRIPDVDVDKDGIEKFLDTDMDGDTKTFRVDTCIDGDGTVIEDELDADKKEKVACTEAKDANGNYRFVDGWSIGLKFKAAPAVMDGLIAPKQ